MNKVRMLVVSPSGIYGGGESYVNNLLTSEKLTNVMKIALIANEQLRNQLEEKGVRCYKILPNTSLGINTIKNIITINRKIKEYKIDIVFLNGLAEIGVYSRYIKSDKIITIGHSNETWMVEPAYKNIKHLFKRIVIFGFERKVKKLIAINKIVNSNALEFGFSKKQLILIYNGVNKIRIEKRNANILIFGRMSRLCEGKGNYDLICSFSKLVEEYPNIFLQLIIAGTGDDKVNLIELSKRLKLEKNIKFIGHVKPEIFFEKIDCMISPSYMEATPLVILEAMSCNIPIIATDVGGVPELISNNKSALLVEPKNIFKLKEAMKFCIENKDIMRHMASNAKDEFNLKYTVDVMSTEVLKVIMSMKNEL